MYTIGEIATLGHVSVRMLRHWDNIGLLHPARVDSFTGYRHYELAQLADLVRIVELRNLGCSLDDAAVVLADAIADGALERVLRARREALMIELATNTDQLAAIDRRLSVLKGTEPMSQVTYKSVEAVTVYSLSDVIGDGETPTTVIERLLPQLEGALIAAGVDYLEPGVFWYDSVAGTDDQRVSISWVAGANPTPGEGYDVVTLPEIQRAAFVDYHGAPSGIEDAWNAFSAAVVNDGAELIGGCREVYLKTEPHPESEWITQLQQQVRV